MRAIASVLVGAVLSSALAGAPFAQRTRGTASGDLVELDVVVLDRHDRLVTGLGLSDFQVKEDGRIVELKTFATATTAAEDAPGRQLVLLLDDSSVPVAGTSVVQAMARVILSRKQLQDEVTVVRLNNDRDEAFGDLQTAIDRIDRYRAGAVPFQSFGTAERALKVYANVARQLEAVEHRRKLIVCIGGPRVCNVLEPVPHGYSPNWPVWVRALSAAARANVAVYAVMPVPVGTPIMLAGGIAELTGGDGFANASNFETFVDNLWREAGEYYLLGYWPTSDRELHSIEVKTIRKELHVRARRRG